MANEEQLAILAQGVMVWNEWKKKNFHRITIDLSGANFSQANLKEADFGGADLRGANLCEANLFRASFVEADASNIDLSVADLSEAMLFETDLSGANLSDANLSDADLFGANLQRADLSRATLTRTDLRGTNLSEANFDSANFGITTLGDVDLSKAKGLETAKHWSPSTVGIDTIYKSKGKIPEVFLRDCGVPDNFVTFMHSLTGKAFEFYSCFISYSTQDKDFAERIYADLQSKGVRCWFAPEDLKIGDKFRTRIDEAIRVYDKLLIVLSENSINSEWVEKEVETAFEKERQQRRTMLFPVRLDDAVMKTDQSWAADIRRTRHIGNMTGWKDHTSYQRAFERLLRDLQAESTTK